MSQTTFRTNIPAEKIYALDYDTLFLLRTCAMEAISDYQSNRKFHSIEELDSHLSSVSETWGYFTCLKKAIGMKESGKYFVSESVLQRAFGLYKSKSALKESTLNFLTQFICDMNWSEYNTPNGRKMAREKILRRIIKPAMKTVINGLTSRLHEPVLPKLKEGDKIVIVHIDGSTDTYEYSA